MKKVALITLLAIGYIITAVDAKNPTKDKDDYEWLIKEVEILYEEDLKIGQTETKIFVYDEEGNEVVSFEESAYDELSAEMKRKVSQSEFLFDAMGDQIFILAN